MKKMPKTIYRTLEVFHYSSQFSVMFFADQHNQTVEKVKLVCFSKKLNISFIKEERRGNSPLLSCRTGYIK
jgi:hypothetical protein